MRVEMMIVWSKNFEIDIKDTLEDKKVSKNFESRNFPLPESQTDALHTPDVFNSLLPGFKLVAHTGCKPF